jgi:hypothetical protein
VKPFSDFFNVFLYVCENLGKKMKKMKWWGISRNGMPPASL